MKMLVRYDSEADATTVQLEDSVVVGTVEVLDGHVLVDVDDGGSPVSVEILSSPADVTEAVYEALGHRFPALDVNALRTVLAGRSTASA